MKSLIGAGVISILGATGMMSYAEPTYTVGKPRKGRLHGRLSVTDIRAVAEDLQPRKSIRRTRRLRGKGKS